MFKLGWLPLVLNTFFLPSLSKLLPPLLYGLVVQPGCDLPLLDPWNKDIRQYFHSVQQVKDHEWIYYLHWILDIKKRARCVTGLNPALPGLVLRKQSKWARTFVAEKFMVKQISKDSNVTEKVIDPPPP